MSRTIHCPRCSETMEWRPYTGSDLDEGEGKYVCECGYEFYVYGAARGRLLPAFYSRQRNQYASTDDPSRQEILERMEVFRQWYGRPKNPEREQFGQRRLIARLSVSGQCLASAQSRELWT